jgi:hypothetical protein
VRILPSAVALAAALAAAPSLAAPLSAEVTVERAPEAADCPSAGELQAAIERIVQRPVVAAHGERLVADVQFLRGKDGNQGFEALVRLAGAKQGERRLTDTGGSCAPLAQAVAVTLALLVDLGPEPRPMPSVSPLDPRSRGEIWLFGGGGLGLTAGPTAAGGGGAAVAWARWSLRASGGAVLPREAELSPGSVRVGLARGELLLCRALASGLRARLDACAGGTIGWLSGRGQGYPVSMNAGFWWVAAEAAIRLGGVVGGRFLWGLQAGLAVPSARHTFSVENAGVAYRSSPVAGLLELQVGARLW